MSISTILLILFLLALGAVTLWGSFQYSSLLLGVLAIAAAVFMIFRK